MNLILVANPRHKRIEMFQGGFHIPRLDHFYLINIMLRQVSGIKYLNQMSTYHLACGVSEIT